MRRFSRQYYPLRLEALESRLVPDRATFTGQLYRDFLGRAADPGGRDYWAGQADVVGRQLVALGLLGSAEGRRQVVRDLYVNDLGREPDEGGLHYFSTALGTGATLEDLRAGLLGSPEYLIQRTGGTIPAFVTSVYLDVLGRSPEPEGLAFWSAAVETPLGRSGVAGLIQASPEGRRQTAKEDAHRLLGRVPDDAGLGQLLAGAARREDTLARLAASDDYQARADRLLPPPPGPVHVLETQPMAGETLVSPARTVTVRFSGAIDPATITTETFSLLANGQPLAGTVRLSPVKTFATFFPAAPLPASTEVRVALDGDRILTTSGARLDADDDGLPGGRAEFSFRTLPLSRIPGTNLFGYVYDSYNKNPDGSDRPVVGATIRVDAFPEANAVTDATGRFELRDVPAPVFFVHVDGSTATNAPVGTSYPSVGKPFHSVPGQTVPLSMNEVPFHVFLPPMAASDVVDLSTTRDIPVGFGPSGRAELAQLFPGMAASEWDKVQVTYPAGSAIDDQGRPASQAIVLPVPPNRLPAPLPPQLNPKLVISVQAPAATLFDVPAPFTFPNLDNLPVGSRPALWSFDHALGAWGPIGTGTVVEDGRGGTVVVSDPGVGIRAPGWHLVSPPTSWAGNDKQPKKQGQEPAPTILADVKTTDAKDVLSLEFEPPEGPPKEPGKHEKKNDPYKKVTILLNGPLQDYYKQTRGPKIGDGIVFERTLKNGDKKLAFRFEQLSLKELQDREQGGRPFNINTLFGSQMSIRVEDHRADGSTSIERTIYLPYVFVDAADDQHQDRRIDFEDILGNGTVQRAKEINIENGGASLEASASGPFSASSPGDEVRFRPTTEAAGQTGTLTLKTTVEGRKITLGTLALRGNGLAKQHWFIDTAQMKSALNLLLASGEVLPAERPFLEQDQDAFLAEVVSRARSLMSGFSAGLLYGQTANAHVFDEFSLGLPLVPIDSNILKNINTELGNQINFLKTAQTDIDDKNGPYSVTDVLKNADQYGRAEQTFRLSRALNESQAGRTQLFLDRFLFLQHTLPESIGPIRLLPYSGAWRREDLINSLAGTIAHEFAHGLGLEHTSDTNDVMSTGNDRMGVKQFGAATSAALRIALGMSFSDDDAQTALSYYEASPANGQSFLDGGADVLQQPLSPNGLLLVRDENAQLSYDINFGSVVTDNSSATKTLTLHNSGGRSLALTAARIDRSAAVFVLLDDISGRVLAPSETTTLRIRFDPVAAGPVDGTLVLGSDDAQPEVRVGLTGFGTTPTLALAARVPNNNSGGAVVGGDSVVVPTFSTLTNRGAVPLTIMGADLAAGAADFRILGFDPNQPVTLATGQSLELGLIFAPSHTGLIRGSIRITTNDVTQPVLNLPVVGTGLPTGELAFHWGGDTLTLDYGNFTRRLVTNAVGGFMLDIPALTDYQVRVFDPISGLIATDGGTSAPSGAFTDLTSNLRFLPSKAPDTDGDGLPDDIERVLGTDLVRADSNNDGIDDFSALQQGLDPLAGRAVPTGFVSSVELPGGGTAVDVEGKVNGPGQLAYVATGPMGLAIVDVSEFTNPIILGQLDLPGDAVSIAVDPALAIAAVATVEGGLCLVDVSDPMQPRLRSVVNVRPFQVVVADGVAYAGLVNGGGILAVDLVSGEPLRSFIPPPALESLAVLDNVLYVLSTSFLSTYAIGADEFRPLGGTIVAGSLPPLSAGRPLVVAGDRAYIGSFSGYSIVDISDPAQPRLLTQPPSIQLVDHDLALNGSGLLVASTSFAGIGTFAVSLYDARSDDDVTRFLTSFRTPNEKPSLTLASGLGFVVSADLNGAEERAGIGRLRVLNYRPFDNLGLAPTVSLSSLAPDVDPAAGVQVASGTRLPIRVTTTDDVQVRNVEILVNGRVVANRVSYPFDISIIAAAPSEGGPLLVQARATDTGGNNTLSNVLTFEVVSRAPRITATSPAPGLEVGRSPAALRLTLDKPLDPNRLPTTSAFQLVGAGADGLFGTGDDVSVGIATIRANPSAGELALTPASLLSSGVWRLTALSTEVRDLAGVALDGEFSGTLPSGNGTAGGDFVLEFRVLPLRVVASTPAPGLRTDVPISSLSVTLSRAIDGASLTAADFRLVAAGADRLFGTADDRLVDLSSLTFTAGNVGITLSPTTPLTPDVYRFTAPADRLRDTQGLPLDGEFADRFPTGDGVPGGDFVATFEVLTAVPVAETPFPMPVVETAPPSPDPRLITLVGTGPALFVDVDGDGKRDLVRGNENIFDPQFLFGLSVSVLLGQGEGTFAHPLVLPLTAPPRDLEAGDVNGDGKLDLVALTHTRVGDPETTSPFAFRVFLGNGNGTFADPIMVDPAAFARNAPHEADFVLAELTGDGRTDLAVLVAGTSSPTRLLLLSGQGDGTFAAPVDLALGRDALNDHLLRAADLNGDGKTDLITQTTVLLGHGDGTFTASAAPARAVTIASGVLLLADFDKDGRLDLLTDAADDTVAFHSGRGDGTFGTPGPGASTRLGALFAATFGDLNGDSRLDLVLHGDFRRDAQQNPVVDGQVAVLLGQDNGTFGNPQILPLSFTGGAAISTLAVVDVNGDGRADVMAAQQAPPTTGPSVVFVLGRGDGTFQMSLSDAALATRLPRLLADANGDGRLDIITFSGTETPGLLVRPGQGDGSFGAAMVSPLSWLASAVPEDLLLARADLNGDGRADVVAGVKELTDNNLRVLLGQGDGTFTAAPNPASVGQLLDVALADVSGDSVPDLVLTHRDATFGLTSITIRPGRGDGTFGAAVTNGPFDQFGRPALVDLNGDGKTDILTTFVIAEGGLSGGVTTYLSNGDGTLTSPGGIGLPELDPARDINYSLATPDLNGDNTPDLVIAATDRVFTYRGNGDGTFALPQTLPGSLPGALTALDLDGDHLIDLVFSNAGLLRILFGKADGTWETPREIDAPLSIRALAGDLNGDGRADIVAGATVLLQRGR